MSMTKLALIGSTHLGGRAGREGTHRLQDEADQQQRHGSAEQHRGHEARDVHAVSGQCDGNQEHAAEVCSPSATSPENN